MRLDDLARVPADGEVVTLAVDEENANGRAFVTEYAGTSDVVLVRDGPDVLALR